MSGGPSGITFMFFFCISTSTERIIKTKRESQTDHTIWPFFKQKRQFGSRQSMGKGEEGRVRIKPSLKDVRMQQEMSGSERSGSKLEIEETIKGLPFPNALTDF